MFKTKIVAAAVFCSTVALGSAAEAQYMAKEWPDGPMKQRFVSTCGGATWT